MKKSRKVKRAFDPIRYDLKSPGWRLGLGRGALLLPKLSEERARSYEVYNTLTHRLENYWRRGTGYEPAFGDTVVRDGFVDAVQEIRSELLLGRRAEDLLRERENVRHTIRLREGAVPCTLTRLLDMLLESALLGRTVETMIGMRLLGQVYSATKSYEFTHYVIEDFPSELFARCLEFAVRNRGDIRMILLLLLEHAAWYERRTDVGCTFDSFLSGNLVRSYFDAVPDPRPGDEDGRQVRRLRGFLGFGRYYIWTLSLSSSTAALAILRLFESSESATLTNIENGAARELVTLLCALPSDLRRVNASEIVFPLVRAVLARMRPDDVEEGFFRALAGMDDRYTWREADTPSALFWSPDFMSVKAWATLWMYAEARGDDETRRSVPSINMTSAMRTLWGEADRHGTVSRRGDIVGLGSVLAEYGARRALPRQDGDPAGRLSSPEDVHIYFETLFAIFENESNGFVEFLGQVRERAVSALLGTLH